MRRRSLTALMLLSLLTAVPASAQDDQAPSADDLNLEIGCYDLKVEPGQYAYDPLGDLRMSLAGGPALTAGFEGGGIVWRTPRTLTAETTYDLDVRTRAGDLLGSTTFETATGCPFRTSWDPPQFVTSINGITHLLVDDTGIGDDVDDLERPVVSTASSDGTRYSDTTYAPSGESFNAVGLHHLAPAVPADDTRLEVVYRNPNGDSLPYYVQNPDKDAQYRRSNIRIAGADRYETAVAAARKVPGDIERVIIATGQDFPDALAAANVTASDRNGTNPVMLLTPRNSLHPAVADYLRGATDTLFEVTIMGGTAAITQEVEDAINDIVSANFVEVTRIAGATRYETALLAAEELDAGFATLPIRGKRSMVLASGSTFPDALVASSLVIGRSAPLLLVPPTGLRRDLLDQIRDFADEQAIAQVVLVGGEAALSATVERQIKTQDLSVVRLAGRDRSHTSTLVADELRTALGFDILDEQFVDPAGGLSAADIGWQQMGGATVSRGSHFPDALAASQLVRFPIFDVTGETVTIGEGAPETYVETRFSPVLLTPDATTVGAELETWLADTAGCGVSQIVAMGGPVALSDDVVGQLSSDCQRAPIDPLRVLPFDLSFAEVFDSVLFATGYFDPGNMAALIGDAVPMDGWYQGGQSPNDQSLSALTNIEPTFWLGDVTDADDDGIEDDLTVTLQSDHDDNPAACTAGEVSASVNLASGDVDWRRC